MVKLLATGDIHKTHKCPENRIDDYTNAQKEKLSWINNFALDNNCWAILEPGDVFDLPSTPYGTVNQMVEERQSRTANVPEIAIFGQHDLRYHSLSRRNDTPLYNLYLSGWIKIAGPEPIKNGDVCIYGASYGEHVPSPLSKDQINVLLIHRMVIRNTKSKLWADQKDFITAKELIKAYPEYSIFICGDNHTSFVEQYNGRWAINCGSLMRSTTAQFDHEPIVALIEIDDSGIVNVKTHKIPINPATDVFDVEKKEREVQNKEQMERFIQSLGSGLKAELDFIRNIEIMAKESKISEPVMNIVWEAIDGYQSN